MSKGKIIILDGCPSAGKTTIAKKIQEQSDEPYLYAGIDVFVHMIPAQWITFSQELTKAAGFEFVLGTDEQGRPSIKLGLGEWGEKLILGYVNAIRGLAEAGNNVIADGVITKAKWLEYISLSLKDFDTCFVGLFAPLEVLEERERYRLEPAGQARGRFQEVYSLEKSYDLIIDTSKISPDKAAKNILTSMKKKKK